MPKNLSRYYQAWELRQQGKKLKEIGNIMGFGVERARILINYINFKIGHHKPLPIAFKLKIEKILNEKI